MVDYFAVFKGRHVWPRAKTPIHTACVIETSGAIGRALPKPMLTSHNQDGFLQQTCPLQHPLHTGENTGLGAAFQVLIPPAAMCREEGDGLCPAHHDAALDARQILSKPFHDEARPFHDMENIRSLAFSKFEHCEAVFTE